LRCPGVLGIEWHSITRHIPNFFTVASTNSPSA